MNMRHILFLILLLTIAKAPTAMANGIDSTSSNPLNVNTDTTKISKRISIGCGVSVSPFFLNVGNSNGIQTNINHGMSLDFLLRYSVKPRYSILTSLSLISHGQYADKDNPYFLGVSSLFQMSLFGNAIKGLTIAAGPRISYNISIFGASYPNVFKHLLTEVMGRVTYEINTEGSIYAFGIESGYFLTESESKVRLMTASVFFNYFF
jgi:hypothetical protein